MELHQLKIFQAVADCGSFSAAADQVHLTQPAVSMQIALLEEELGCRLFHRDRNGAVLTQEGSVVIRSAGSIGGEVAALKRNIQGHLDLSKGHLSIACSDTFAAYALAPLVSSFGAKYPGIRFTVANCTSREIVSRINQYAADIGFLSIDRDVSDVDARPYMEYRDVAVAAPEHPVASKGHAGLEELLDYPLLLLERGTRSRETVDRALSELGAAPDNVIELGSVAVQQEFAAAGLGVAIVPEYSVERPVKERRLVAVHIKSLRSRVVSAVTRKGRYASAALKAFMEMCLPGD